MEGEIKRCGRQVDEVAFENEMKFRKRLQLFIQLFVRNRGLCAKNREINVFPPRILIKSSTTYNFLKIELILKVSGLN
jgi:hypothetical protein